MTPQEQWTAVDGYLAGLFAPSDPALDAALASSAAAGMPAIHVSATQGKLLMLLARAVGARRSGREWLSVTLYAVAVALAFVNSWLACGVYAAVAAMWLIPDRRIERAMGQTHRDDRNPA